MLHSSRMVYSHVAMKILAVDDDPELLSHLVARLETRGHRVSTAENGAEALRVLADAPFDVLLSDLEMPEVDGETLIREVRHRWPELRILVISSHPEADSIATSLGVPSLPKSASSTRLSAALDGIARGTTTPAANPRQTEPAETKVVFRSRRPPRRKLDTWGVVAVAALVVAVLAPIGFLRPGESPPILPDRPNPGVVRGTSLELIEPTGPLAAAPLRLRWETLDLATDHRVVFERVDGQVIFRQKAPWQLDSEGAQVFELPADFRESLQPMAVYHWWVEALAEDGTSIARSSRERFRILVDSPTSLATGDS